MTLPRGSKTVEDEHLIKLLIQDEIFKQSIESEYGKISNLFPEWERNVLVCQFLNGDVQEYYISGILRKLRALNYMNEFAH